MVVVVVVEEAEGHKFGQVHGAQAVLVVLALQEVPLGVTERVMGSQIPEGLAERVVVLMVGQVVQVELEVFIMLLTADQVLEVKEVVMQLPVGKEILLSMNH